MFPEKFSPLEGAILSSKHDRGELTLDIAPDRIVDACRFLKYQAGFIRLSDLTAIDLYPDVPRFQIVYHLHSLEHNERLRLKVRIAGEVDSVTEIWRSANWYEREVFDLFGVKFRNHPELQRILLPAEWDGHPLRKDYPITGSRV